MSNQNIHPTAIIEQGAEIGKDVKIGPYCVIGPDVKLGDYVTLKSHVVVDGCTEIGEGTVVFPFASLGSAPQDLKYANEKTRLVIGKNNRIREHVTMNPGTAQDNGATIVGDNGLFMMASHVAHDCVIGNNVIMANNATLAGHVHLGDYVIVGGLSAIHQHSRIGDHAIIGGMSPVENDVIPYGRVKGERAFLKGLNLIGLERRGYSKDDIKAMQRAFNELFGGEATFDERVESVSEAYGENENVMKIVDFIKEKTEAPLCQPQKKA